MYTPHTVTLYNISTETDPVTFRDTELANITILRGVFLDASKGSNVIRSGLEGADAAVLHIPFSVEAVDGITGEPKRYVGPMEYWSAEDKSEVWTLSANNRTFFVKGVAVVPADGRPSTFERVSLSYDGVYTVTKVDEKDFGSQYMQHWEVGGA